MERGYDVTFPKIPLTGNEKTLEQLIQPDERSVGYGFGAVAISVSRNREAIARCDSKVAQRTDSGLSTTGRVWVLLLGIW